MKIIQKIVLKIILRKCHTKSKTKPDNEAMKNDEETGLNKAKYKLKDNTLQNVAVLSKIIYKKIGTNLF